MGPGSARLGRRYGAGRRLRQMSEAGLAGQGVDGRLEGPEGGLGPAVALHEPGVKAEEVPVARGVRSYVAEAVVDEPAQPQGVAARDQRRPGALDDFGLARRADVEGA